MRFQKLKKLIIKLVKKKFFARTKRHSIEKFNGKSEEKLEKQKKMKTWKCAKKLKNARKRETV